MIIKTIFRILSKPTIHYPIIVIVVFSLLRMLNLYLETIIGFQMLGPISIGIIVGYLFGRIIESERKTYNLAITDSLTGLYNRTGFSSKLDYYFSRFRENDHVSIISIDIDGFKEINDNYGHEIGDKAISTIGSIIRKNTRSTDTPARCGGDEFTIFLPHAHYKTALRIAESILKEVNETPINPGKGEAFTLRVSIGLATSTKPLLSKDKLLKLSDDKMYESKNSGKNKISGIKV